MTAGAASPSTAPERAPSRTDQLALTVAAFGTFLALTLFTLPLAALGPVSAALGAGPDAQTWILSSMSVGLAAGLLITGALADDYGRRRMFLIGAVVVAVTCVLGVLTTSPVVFVLARVAQGLGGAAVISCALGVIGHTFPGGRHRVRATGIWGAAVGAGIAVGPLLAAVVPGWRWPYVVVAVLGAGLAVAARLLLAESRSGHRRAVDVPGVVLLGAGTGALLAGLVTGRGGWTRAETVLLLAAGVLLLAGFVVREWRAGAPLLELTLFRRPDFVAVTVAALSTGLGVIAAMSFSPVLISRGLGGSALAAAVGVLVWSGVSVPVALLARRLRTTGETQLATGLAVVAVGLVLLSGLAPGDGLARLLAGLAVAGVGSGVLNAALGRQAVASVPAGRAAMGSGANNTARYLGSAIGVTIVAVLANHPDPVALIAGWNVAVLVTAGFSVLGAVVVLVCRFRLAARH